MPRLLILCLIAIFMISGTVQTAMSDPSNKNRIPIYSYKIIQTYAHDPKAFTQGLIFQNGCLYESTGAYGVSSLRKVELCTGKILQIQKLSSQYFGEGLTIFKNKIIQLTWRSNIGFVYDKESFAQIQTFEYPTEGWGLTNNGKHLIMSDGSAMMYFLDPKTFEITKQVQVQAAKEPVKHLNELEYIQGEIYANIWQTDRLVKIDPNTGQVKAWIELNGLLNFQEIEQANVLNGIAYDAENDRLFVTGKLWPKLFEIKVIRSSS